MNTMNGILIPKTEPKIAKTWFTGGNAKYPTRTVTLAIPRDFAIAYNLEKPTNVVITPTPEGLLIKRLEIAK